ncbi:MAG: ADP-ribosylglycohydrolase family protein [Candidatus Sericytochromatia bacterium]|nr:ADP-ribosylglycohydrolase family protein [Candidatus Sericytochromatia bacterium]
MRAPSENAYRGCLLGLALGDAAGAPYEGGPLERALWGLLGHTRTGKHRWTDDTQMTLDLGESLLVCQGLNPDHLAEAFARSYRWHRGYGPGMARLLKRIRRGESWQQANRAVYPDGSFGNGAAMRAPVLALFYFSQPAELLAAARQSAEITHAHPLGVAGAVLLASATAALLRGSSDLDFIAQAVKDAAAPVFETQWQEIQGWQAAGHLPEARELARSLGNGMTAASSCMTALYLAWRFRALPFEDLLHFARRLGGDVDTLCAMSGALWGAANGAEALPQERLQRLEQLERLQALADALYQQAQP